MIYTMEYPKLYDCGNPYGDFNHIFASKVNKHALKKKKWIRRNNNPHINKTLRHAIMKRSRLKVKQAKVKTLLILKIIKNNVITL